MSIFIFQAYNRKMNQLQKATGEGTANYKSRFKGSLADSHFRESQGMWLSSIGLGTYLGNADEQTDRAYRAAITRAVELGCNIFDTAANYRFQRSERNVGDALAGLISKGVLARNEVIVTTKGGYIPFDNHPPRNRQEMTDYLEETFIKPGICDPSDFVQGSHCMRPKYLAHQLDQSLSNLRLDCVDVYYIHNPESQFAQSSREEFYRRLRDAFEFLESAVEAGKISMYGTATWSGYRVDPNKAEYISLEQVAKTAREVGGQRNHFKVVQLPVNLSMIEAFTARNQTLDGRKSSFLDAAAELGITVMASSSIQHGQLVRDLAPIVGESMTGLRTDAQRALQFTRSTPDVVTALVGMSNISHVEENLELAKVSPAALEDYLNLFDIS